MHTQIIEAIITPQEYASVLINEVSLHKSRSPTGEYLKIRKLHNIGLRVITYSCNYFKHNEHCYTSYKISILLNLGAFICDEQLHSYDPSNFNYPDFIDKLETTLKNNISGYAELEHQWRYSKIEFSKDLYFDSTLMQSILSKCDYINGQKKMTYISHPSGIEFRACTKNGQITSALHIYSKVMEKTNKGYQLSAHEQAEASFYRVEKILYNDAIGDKSRIYGFPLGDIPSFTDSTIEQTELLSIIHEIYGSNPYYKRAQIRKIIEYNIANTSMQRKLISFLDKINRSSISKVREQFKKNRQLQIFKKYVSIIEELGINLIYLPYDYHLNYVTSLPEQLAKII